MPKSHLVVLFPVMVKDLDHIPLLLLKTHLSFIFTFRRCSVQHNHFWKELKKWVSLFSQRIAVNAVKSESNNAKVWPFKRPAFCAVGEFEVDDWKEKCNTMTRGRIIIIIYLNNCSYFIISKAPKLLVCSSLHFNAMPHWMPCWIS